MYSAVRQPESQYAAVADPHQLAYLQTPPIQAAGLLSPAAGLLTLAWQLLDVARRLSSQLSLSDPPADLLTEWLY